MKPRSSCPIFVANPNCYKFPTHIHKYIGVRIRVHAIFVDEYQISNTELQNSGAFLLFNFDNFFYLQIFHNPKQILKS